MTIFFSCEKVQKKDPKTFCHNLILQNFSGTYVAWLSNTFSTSGLRYHWATLCNILKIFPR